MDVAGRLGYSSDYTKIGIYVDGVRIGGDDNTSIVNWDIFAPHVGITLQPHVLASQEEDTNLAVLTGLVVKKV
ncbi:MAG: hypothetical protein KDI39_09065 [Pseudomonadales bacterium]|nr:hypothetical protein [Pseudomonadales bacterium]